MKCNLESFVGHRLRSPEDVVDLVRRYEIEIGTLVLGLDAEQCVFVVVPACEPDVLSAVAQLACRGAKAAVIATVRSDGPASAANMPAQLADLRLRSSVPVLDWIVVAGHRWRSMSEVGAPPRPRADEI